MTFVELLVVVAIIGTLAALLLPAILAARESARRVECQSNLKQNGLGMALHAERKGIYPTGCIGGRQLQSKACISWNVQLLPFLELGELWSLFDFNVASYHANNQAVRATLLKIFLCPSTDSAELYSSRDAWQGAAFTDYGGIYGVEGVGRDAERALPGSGNASDGPPRPAQTLREDSLGVLLFDEGVHEKQITDGLSKTVSIAEATLRRVAAKSEWVNGLNLFAQEQSTPINGVGLDGEIGSPHPGGALLVFCDGHVEFVSEQVEQAVLNAMLTKAGGDP